MLAQKGTDYLDKDGNLDLTNDKVVEVLQYIKDMQDAGALATVAGGQPDNEEAYPEYNSGNFAVQIMPFWQTSRFTNYMSDLEGKIAIALLRYLETTMQLRQSVVVEPVQQL